MGVGFLRAIHPGTYCKPARPLLPASAVTWLTPKFPHCAIQLVSLLPVAPFPGSSPRGLVPTSPLPTLQPSRGKTQSSLYEALRWSVRDPATPSGSPVPLLGSLAIPLPLQHVTSSCSVSPCLAPSVLLFTDSVTSHLTTGPSRAAPVPVGPTALFCFLYGT